VVAAARREERPADHPGAVYEIPLDEEIETALEGAFASSARPPSAEARPARASSETRALPRTPLLSALDERALRALTERMALRRFAQGERIIREGEVGEALYILVEGQVLVYREGPPRVPLTHLDEGDFFGEIALLTKRARSASVEAVGGEVVVLELPRAMLSELVDEHPAVLGVLLRFFRERLVESLLETGELFAPFTNAERRDLVARFAFIEVEPETCLIAQGRTADGLYLLLAGELQVVRADEGGASRSLARLGPGSVVGEISLLTSGPAVASIHARGKCWLLRLDRHTFNEVILTHPQVLAFLTELADARRALNAAILSEERPYQELALPLL
jgi:CRP-like cAMP-binding protein